MRCTCASRPLIVCWKDMTHLDVPALRDDPARVRATVAAAHRLLRTPAGEAVDAATWRRYLQWSAHPDVLTALDDDAARRRWADDAAVLCARLQYTLGDLVDDRVEECGNDVYLESLAEQRRLTYAETQARIRRIAAAFHAIGSPAIAAPPRVLVFAANSIETALCDLACLCHGILVAPVSVMTDADDLAWMLARLDITLVVTDTHERVVTLATACAALAAPPTIVVTRSDHSETDPRIRYLDDLVAAHGHAPLPDATRDAFATATVMFTSGSTGRPKGICFSQHALVTKRFARAAALPDVGRGETLVAYLPLFHTFGRFLELQGMLFWRGRYVFAQDGSREALLAGLRTVQPTGLIGIPLRWSQLADAALARMDGKSGDDALAAFRDVCGERLRWGLSAAGWLDPTVFSFFHRCGVELASGFGMTEATGGILMTPPGAWEAGSVGTPLPCIEVRLAAANELEIRGPYVAMPLPETGPLPVAVASPDPADHPWFPTGDVFQQRTSGHYEIIDRVKDIYKNSRGQTVSPLGIEKLFRGIPGFRRVFAAGDGREYTVLLIVPDTSHPLFADLTDDERDDTIREIIRIANAQLPPHERIVRYALLARDFEADRGELTPKNSYNRAAVARNFADTIAALYRGRTLTCTCDGLALTLPHWLLRELGVTEHDIVHDDRGIRNRATGRRLRVARGEDAGSWQIGDLVYTSASARVDLGLLCRQPLGWVGNPSLAAMFPCREGWDAALPVDMEIRVIGRAHDAPAPAPETTLLAGVSLRLRGVHTLLATLLHGDPADALALVDAAAVELDRGGRHIGGVVRARLAALAWHHDLQLRCAAYAALLLYDPTPEQGDAYAAFVRSGRPFLTDASIRDISALDLRQGRLAALRARLQRYREDHVFEGATGTAVVRSVLELLTSLAEGDAAYVFEVRAELCHWMRHEAERSISTYGSDTLFQRLRTHYLQREASWCGDAAQVGTVRGALRFDQALAPAVRERLVALFTATPFLPLSMLMLHEIPVFEAGRLAGGGIWVSALPGFGAGGRYLASITTRDERQYQLQILLHPDMRRDDVLATMHTFIALSGAASEQRVLPRFGSFMPDAGAVSMQYVRGATVWDELLRLAGRRDHPAETTRRMRTLFVRGMAAFITAWQQSGRSIIPGAAHPANVTVPDDCVRGGAMIHSIDGWSPCAGPASLLHALRHHFYAMTAAHLPELRGMLDPVWICDAAREALGDAAGTTFIETLLALPAEAPAAAPCGCDDASAIDAVDDDLRRVAHAWLDDMRARWIAPLALDSAIACYREWMLTHDASAHALRERYARDLARLFDIGRLGDIGRYTLYRHTVFADARTETRTAFDQLLVHMHQRPSLAPTRLPAMNRLLDSLSGDDERHALLHMVSPSADVSRHALLAVAGVRVLQRRIGVRTGESFMLRDAVGAAEIGLLYDLFLREQFPVVISDRMQYLVLVDEWHRIEGGAGYAIEDDGTLSVELLIIHPSLRGMGLGAATIDELLRRAADAGSPQLRAPWYLRPFCLRMGFVEDTDNGDLRRAVPPADGTVPAQD